MRNARADPVKLPHCLAKENFNCLWLVVSAMSPDLCRVVEHMVFALQPRPPPLWSKSSDASLTVHVFAFRNVLSCLAYKQTEGSETSQCLCSSCASLCPATRISCSRCPWWHHRPHHWRIGVALIVLHFNSYSWLRHRRALWSPSFSCTVPFFSRVHSYYTRSRAELWSHISP